MSNTIADAINSIAILASLNTNTTYASDTVKTNWNQTSQTSRERMITEFIEYGDHIAYVNPKDGELWLIDTIAGITPAIDINNFEIKSIVGQSQGKLIGKIVADLTIKEFNSGGVGGTPSLDDMPIQLSLATNQPSQDEYAIKVKSEPTTLSGSDVVYSYTDVNKVLARKKTIYESSNITLVYNSIIDIQIGQRINFDNTFDDDIDSLKGSGAMTVKDISFDTTNLKTTISGIGTFNEA
jgi:hypothetical protein